MRVMVIYPSDNDKISERKYVVETKASDVKAALEEVWRRFNRVTGNPAEEDCVALRCRSMCVGDVIRAPLEPDGKYYLCLGAGWREIGIKEFAEVRKMNFMERSIKFSFKSE